MQFFILSWYLYHDKNDISYCSTGVSLWLSWLICYKRYSLSCQWEKKEQLYLKQQTLFNYEARWPWKMEVWDDWKKRFFALFQCDFLPRCFLMKSFGICALYREAVPWNFCRRYLEKNLSKVEYSYWYRFEYRRITIGEKYRQLVWPEYQ